jgi:hypothetical protein
MMTAMAGNVRRGPGDPSGWDIDSVSYHSIHVRVKVLNRPQLPSLQ